MTFYPTLPAVDAARSGWLFYIGKDAKTPHASHRSAPVGLLNPALADGGNRLLIACSPLITPDSSGVFFEVS